MNLLVENYCEFPSVVRKPMWQIWHQLMIWFDRDKTVNFMNYGYQSLNGDKFLELKKQDETNRYCIQLYDHVVNKSDLLNKDVVEIGSGRGGGASYISRYYKPRSYTGLDISNSVINFCNRFYKVPGLSFVKGIAEKPPFKNSAFDIVINVESARCYSSLKTFFSEVRRILKPGGYFLFADVITKGEVVSLRKKLKECGFRIRQESEITRNIVAALDQDTKRREILINEKVPSFLRNLFAQFAAVKGTKRYDKFATGEFEYWSYVLQ